MQQKATPCSRGPADKTMCPFRMQQRASDAVSLAKGILADSISQTQAAVPAEAAIIGNLHEKACMARQHRLRQRGLGEWLTLLALNSHIFTRLLEVPIPRMVPSGWKDPAV